MMDLSAQKEQFSRAYVHAVSAAAGYATDRPPVDDDSIDQYFSGRGGSGTLRAPRLEAQLKCTSQDVVSETSLTFPLKIKNYDDLRAENVLVPRILIVVAVPEDVGSWLTHEADQVILRRCGWWFSLRGMPATTNTTAVSITIPRSQIFNPQQLEEIMGRISNQDLP